MNAIPAKMASRKSFDLAFKNDMRPTPPQQSMPMKINRWCRQFNDTFCAKLQRAQWPKQLCIPSTFRADILWSPFIDAQNATTNTSCTECGEEWRIPVLQ